MPSKINDLAIEFGLSKPQKVKWNEIIYTQDEGVYFVSLSDTPSLNLNTQGDAPISQKIINKWINKVDGFEIDKKKTYDSKLVANRLSEFWLPDENILYIGKAAKRSNGSGIGKRVSEYYNTKYGEKRPHAGGHWIKSLTILNNLFVYYIVCDNPSDIELKLLRCFCRNISNSTKKILRDKLLPLPFANLQLKRGQIKNHGLGKMKL